MSHSLWRYLAPLLILLTATALRLHDLGAQSLWSDEGNSVVQAWRSLDEIALHAARDIHPPGYYWLLHVQVRLGGDSEFALRLFSALTSIAGVACLYAGGRLLFGTRAGLAAVLFLALNGFSIWYAREARMYALLALWGAAAALALTALFTRPQRRGRWLLTGVINAAGLWTHYAWPFMLAAQGAVALLWLAGSGLRNVATRRRLLPFVAAMGIALLLYLPWLPTALRQVTTWPDTGIAAPLETALRAVTARLVVGPGFESRTAEWQFVIIGSALILELAGLVPTRGALWRSWLPALWTLVPVALFLALGLYREANLKLLLPAQTGLALWMGRGFAWLWVCPTPLLRLLALVSGGLLVAGMAPAQGAPVHDAAWQRADYRGLVADISTGLEAQDLIILNAPNQLEVFNYYYRGAARVLPLPPGTGPLDAAALTQLRDASAGARQIFALYWGERERDPQGLVEGTLVELTHTVGSRWYGDLRLARYSVTEAHPFGSDDAVRFGEHIMLLRHTRNAMRLPPGSVLQVTTSWRADEELSTRYKIFLQLLDASGRLVVQHDSEPGGGLAPTTGWSSGTTVQDRRALLLPGWLPVGHYTLIIGMYTEGDPARRLPVGDADHLVLGTLEISGENV